MKITILNGSPNGKGTCSSIINSIVDKVSGNHQVAIHSLNTLNIHGCQECFACRTSNSDICFFKDGLSDILEEVKTADMLILASPVFYADLSAQTKCFIDRTWSFFGINGSSALQLPKNRKMIFILSFGYSDADHYDDVFTKYEQYFAMFGFSEISLIKACGAQYFNNRPRNQDEIEREIERIMKVYDM